MKRGLTGVIVVILLLILSWGGYGAFVYSRNTVPDIQLPSIASPPANNSYPQLMEIASRMRQSAQLLAMEAQPHFGTVEQKRTVVAANRDLLDMLRQLADAPCQVIQLSPQPGDPTMENYRHVARLVVAHARLLEQEGQPGRALDAYLDGLAYVENVLRGGNVLHLTFNFMSSQILFQHIPSLIPKLSAQDARRGAQRLERLLDGEYPLHDLLAQEFRTQLSGWERSIHAMAMRGFRLDLPKSPVESALLYQPKAPIIRSAVQYAQQCLQNAHQPYPQQTTIPLPPTLQSLPEGMKVVLAPEEVAQQTARYIYVRTRLRLLYTALRLEAYRKSQGRYPARLAELGDGPYFTDPFSGKPFVYRPQGATYILYSVGPNGIDDGGQPFPEGRLRRDQPGDLGLVPNFPPRP